MGNNKSKVFVTGENIVYHCELPSHLAKKGFPKNVARTELFRLDERNGNTLTFKSGIGYRTTYTAKALQNPKTGGEICFVEYKGARIMLDAAQYFKGGRKITHERMDSLRTGGGRTLRQYLADEAAKPLKERK